ncbi:hypothetical protein An13g00580 [Aspergillus niger]|uniref:Uncharacterized protein n=2 Tax=Aspergillus niger TaxID=5061 RepID=A2R1A9_ASPNC|nr:hypothetical protein An13g00580 [Aspergillus niger]CAK41459.1 hypothetical protein An13g00580 [Aspergillus niger]
MARVRTEPVARWLRTTGNEDRLSALPLGPGLGVPRLVLEMLIMDVCPDNSLTISIFRGEYILSTLDYCPMSNMNKALSSSLSDRRPTKTSGAGHLLFRHRMRTLMSARSEQHVFAVKYFPGLWEKTTMCMIE